MTGRFASLLRHKGFGSIRFDTRFDIVRLSPRAEALLGFSAASKPPGSLLDLFPEFVGVEAHIAASVRRIVLRLYVEQESGATGVSEQDVGHGSRRVYARARGGDRAMMAELGLRGAGDVFVTIVRSERTYIPVARVRPGAPKFMAVPFDVPLRTLREQGHVAGGRFVDTRGRLLTEAEFHRLFGRAVPGSRPR